MRPETPSTQGLRILLNVARPLQQDSNPRPTEHIRLFCKLMLLETLILAAYFSSVRIAKKPMVERKKNVARNEIGCSWYDRILLNVARPLQQHYQNLTDSGFDRILLKQCC